MKYLRIQDFPKRRCIIIKLNAKYKNGKNFNCKTLITNFVYLVYFTTQVLDTSDTSATKATRVRHE